jgi:hypothetical protein
VLLQQESGARSEKLVVTEHEEPLGSAWQLAAMLGLKRGTTLLLGLGLQLLLDTPWGFPTLPGWSRMATRADEAAEATVFSAESLVEQAEQTVAVASDVGTSWLVHATERQIRATPLDESEADDVDVQKPEEVGECVPWRGIKGVRRKPLVEDDLDESGEVSLVQESGAVDAKILGRGYRRAPLVEDQEFEDPGMAASDYANDTGDLDIWLIGQQRKPLVHIETVELFEDAAVAPALAEPRRIVGLHHTVTVERKHNLPTEDDMSIDEVKEGVHGRGEPRPQQRFSGGKKDMEANEHLREVEEIHDVGQPRIQQGSNLKKGRAPLELTEDGEMGRFEAEEIHDVGQLRIQRGSTLQKRRAPLDPTEDNEMRKTEDGEAHDLGQIRLQRGSNRQKSQISVELTEDNTSSVGARGSTQGMSDRYRSGLIKGKRSSQQFALAEAINIDDAIPDKTPVGFQLNAQRHLAKRDLGEDSG